MKTMVWGAMVVGMLAAGSTAQAQYGSTVVVGPRHASTPAESFLRGVADLVRARGQAAARHAAASLWAAKARRIEIENRKQAFAARVAMERMRREAQAARRRPPLTAEQRNRIARQAAPDRLGPSQLDARTGAISWPRLLQEKSYASAREIVSAASARRATAGAMTLADLRTAERTIRRMLARLSADIHQVEPIDFVTARRFLKSLAYEFRLPVG